MCGLLKSMMSAAACWCELIRAAIHTILYIHHVYPRDTFEPCPRHGISVYYCTSPVVQDYIDRLVEDIEYWMTTKKQQVSIRISISSSLEKKQVCYQLELPPMDGWIENNNNSCTLVENLLQWQHIFREVIYRLLYVGPSLWSGDDVVSPPTFQIFVRRSYLELAQDNETRWNQISLLLPPQHNKKHDEVMMMAASCQFFVARDKNQT